MGRHDRLRMWHRAHALALECYRETACWPSSERYALAGQTRRAAVSIGVNLAEGLARRGPRELRRFLDVSLGSLAELQCLLLLGRDLGYLPADTWKRLERERDELGRMFWALYRAVNPAARPNG